MTAEEIADAIVTELWMLRFDWINFKFISTGNKFHVDVLNATAPAFFHRWQQVMYERMLLGIARLFDSADLGGNKNVSFYGLLVASGFEASDSKKHEELLAAVKAAKGRCRACIKHRHKKISHLDQQTRSGLKKLPPTTLKMIDDSLVACEQVVEMFYDALNRGSISFDVGEPEAAQRLIERLANRRSRKMKEVRSQIQCTRGSHHANLKCVYCCSDVPIDYYPTRRGFPSLLARSHYDECDGVIGVEKLEFDVVEITGADARMTLTLDLLNSTQQLAASD